MTSPVPVTGKTPIYQLEYLIEGEPAFWMRARLQRNSEKLEQLLQARAIAPPTASDLAAVSGRVSTLEAINTTAWTVLPLVGGTVLSHDPGVGMPQCQYRVEGRRVWLRGWAKSTNGVAAGVQVFSALPAAIRPSVFATVWPVRSSNFVPVRLDIMADDTGAKIMGALAAGEFINLNAVSWPLA